MNNTVEIFSIEFKNWYMIVIRLNWAVLLCGIIFICLIIFGCKRWFKKKTRRQITLEGMSFGIGDFSCTLTCSNEVQGIAYKLWVELITRKIAIPLEEDDVIAEVYDSWYTAFSAIRELLKTVPGSCLEDASNLIDITTKVLNEGLRPHLTKWQAKYRIWYDQESKESSEAPQIIQKRYQEYAELWDDMIQTNQHIVTFAGKMKEIAFGKR